MPEKFLIIGASSFYGRNFAELVREKGDEVTEASLRSGVLDYGYTPVDYVVNFAAANIVADSWNQASEYCNVNICRHIETFQTLLGKDWLKKYIHVSTPEVYGSTAGWASERHPFNPSTPYAVSRAATDMMLAAYHRAYGFPMCITRTSNIYGPGQPEHRIIPQAFKRLREGGKLELHGGGQSVRGVIHVRDACEATYIVAKLGLPGETYHIAAKHVLTIEALVKMICAQLEKRFDECVVEAPERLGKDYAYRLDSSKVRALGWQDRIRLTEGLRGM